MLRNIYMPVSIVVRQTSGGDQDTYYLGTVEPPKVNGIPIYHDNQTVPPGTRAKNGEVLNVHDALTELWDEWCGETCHNPQPDSKFVDWLVDEKGWTRATGTILHTIET
jgi:hypothetical protein